MTRQDAWTSHHLLPLYFRVESALQQRMNEGDLKPGDRLPSEERLAREYGVSRVTMREAMRRLDEQGYVARRRGRGTFVTERIKEKVSSTKFTGFLEDYYTEIQRVQVKSVQILEMPAPARVADALRIDQGGPVTIVRRVRFLENGPFALTTNYIRVEYGRRLREGDLYRFPLVQIFEQVLGVVFGDAIQTIEAKFATDEVAGLLEVPFGAPILHVERVMRDEAGAPVEVVMSCYRADRYRYMATLVRG
ncbi:MAG: GntR family transcriptional regulator, partial [Candidatus Rokuibacteriota bacterium]